MEEHQSQWVFGREPHRQGPRTPQHPVPCPWRSREHTLNTLSCIAGTHCNYISERQIFKTKVNKHRPKQSEFKCIKQGSPVLQSNFSPGVLKKRDVPSLPQLTMQHPSAGILWLCHGIYWQLSNIWVKNMQRYTGRHWARNMGRGLRWSVVCLFRCIKHVRKIISTFLRKGYKQWKTNWKETKQIFFTVMLNKGGKGKVVNETEAKYFGTILVIRNNG